MTDIQVILGNSNARFSGVTSTMLATLPEVRRSVNTAVLGAHHLPPDVPTLNFRELIKLGRDGKTRVFHARRNDEMIQALIAKKVFGARLKIIFTSTAQRHHSKFTKYLMGQMDGILTTCSAAAFFLKNPADEMIPHGVNLTHYQPPENKEQAWQKLRFPGKYGIGIFGRVRPQKGVDLLVRAAIPLLKENLDPTIVIVGETTPSFASFQKELEQEISEAGLSERIIFHGKRPSSELPALFQAMTLVAALSRNEGFGLTVLEAMASECAVLASHAGAWKDIVRDGTHGALVPCDDLPQTQERLAQLITNHSALIQMGQAGRQHVVDHYAIEQEGAALSRYYLKHLNS